jgi:hypothetical protein
VISRHEKEKKLTSMSAAVKIVIDEYPIGHEFFGNELKDDVVYIYADAVNMYPDTILKMARRHRRDSYISIDRNNSLYKRVKNKAEILRDMIQEEKTKLLSLQERAKKTEQLSLFAHSFLGGFYGQ